MIGVVALARDVALAVGIEILVRDVMDRGTIRQCEARIVLGKHLAQQPDRGKQLMRRQLLVAKHQHRMVDEGAIEPCPTGLVDRAGQIDAEHFRAGMRGERGDRVLHRGCQPVSIGRVGSIAHSLSEASYSLTSGWPSMTSAKASALAAMPPPQ